MYTCPVLYPKKESIITHAVHQILVQRILNPVMDHGGCMYGCTWNVQRMHFDDCSVGVNPSWTIR